MFLSCCLALLTLAPLSLSISPGVKIKLTDKGIEYGRQLGMASIQQKLKTITVPDFSGSNRVRPIGKVQYSLTNLNILDVGLPQSGVDLVPGTGFSLSIGDAFLSMSGNWRVKYLRRIKNSGSFNLNVRGLSITSTVSTSSDATGRPVVSIASCSATVGGVDIKFRGGASWLYNLFSNYVEKALRKALEKQICPLVTNAVTDLNPRLQTLNVVAKVDQLAEIEYSMVSSPVVETSSLELGLKGEFYNIGAHQEPPFSPSNFSLPPQTTNMLYIGVSAFTANSAAFVYNKAGVLSLSITDDMIPQSSPIRLNTKTFGALLPQVAKLYPDLMMKLLVKTVKNPLISFEPNSATVQTAATVTAYAIQPNSTLTPLFVLNLDSSVSAKLFVSGSSLAGNLDLNKFDLTLGTSNVGDFQVKTLSTIFKVVLKLVVIPIANVKLAQGYPLPALGQMQLVNPQLQVLKDYLLIGTDVQFTG